MQEILNEILFELKSLRKEVNRLDKKIDDLEVNIKQYIETRLKEEFEKNNAEISEELKDILIVIQKRNNPHYTDKEIKEEIDRIKEKLDRKSKEDKEVFKSNHARLNKIELTQEYLESKIEDLKNVNKQAKVSV